MKIGEADEILRKYNLDKGANVEFKMKTRNDSGKMNVGLRLRICAEHMEKKKRELQKERERILKGRIEKCPNFEIELENNPYAHPECSFINMIVAKNFCFECAFYIKNVKEIDISIKELSEAAECFRQEAYYDDMWQ